jgi:hypothetical protein
MVVKEVLGAIERKLMSKFRLPWITGEFRQSWHDEIAELALPLTSKTTPFAVGDLQVEIKIRANLTLVALQKIKDLKAITEKKRP